MTDEARVIVQALQNTDCEQTVCYHCKAYKYCKGTLEYAAADLIESLLAELEQVKDERDGLNIMLTQTQTVLETRTRERDAAVEDLRKLKTCKNCVGYAEFLKEDGNIDRCMECDERSNWQWRGVKEES